MSLSHTGLHALWPLGIRNDCKINQFYVNMLALSVKDLKILKNKQKNTIRIRQALCHFNRNMKIYNVVIKEKIMRWVLT